MFQMYWLAARRHNNVAVCAASRCDRFYWPRDKKKRLMCHVALYHWPAFAPLDDERINININSNVFSKLLCLSNYCLVKHQLFDTGTMCPFNSLVKYEMSVILLLCLWFSFCLRFSPRNGREM